MGEDMRDIPHIGRRGLITGVAASAALGATPALAQIPNFGGLAGADIGRLAGQVGDVVSGMNLTEADEIAMGEGYYERFIDQSGGRYNSRADQAALQRFAQPVDRKSTRLNSSHLSVSRMPSSA